MPAQATRPSFFAMVGAVMAALKLKELLDKYKPNSGEGGVVLRDNEDEEAVSLLDTQLPTHRPPTSKRNKGCCTCCGMNCSLFCKALGIVTALFFVWYLLKFIMWMVTPSPTGLENMPGYSTSLGCLDAPYFHNDKEETVINIPIGIESDHSFEISGGAVGTFVIAQGPPDLNQVQYKVAVRSGDKNALQQVTFSYPDEDGVETSHLRVGTPASSSSCVRYDVTLYVPSNLKKLYLESQTATQVKFDSDINVNLDDLSIVLSSQNENNMILPTEKIVASKMSLELFRGWIVGDAAIGDELSIITKQGDGVANIHVHPAALEAPNHLSTANLLTETGSGRTDVFFVSKKSSPHRPISSSHSSSRSGDVYLTYKEAEFSGLIALKSKSYSATGLHSFADAKWTHYVGDQSGADRITINSSGWTGLYF